MEKIFKIRRIIFISFFVFFVVGTIFICAYSRGWIFNPKTFNFQKTGAIFIDTKPKNVIIKIDDKIFLDQSGPINSGTLIQNLLPGIYEIEVEKDGFYPWFKNLEVKSGFVAEAANIILIPEKINQTLIFDAEKLSNFWISQKGKIVSKKDNKLYFYESADSVSVKLKGDDFLGFNIDESKILLRDTKASIFYIYELRNNFSALNLNLLIKNIDSQLIVKKAVFHPFSPNKTILEIKDDLIVFDFDTKAIEKISEQAVSSWALNGFNLYYLKDNSLEIFNLMLKTKNVLENPNLSAFLEESKQFGISPDNRKIAFVGNDNKISIFFIKDQIRDFNKKTGETISINPEDEIKNIYWYFDSSHFFVESADGINFWEVDERKPINHFPIAENISQFYYENPTNTIYLLKDGFINKWQIKY